MNMTFKKGDKVNIEVDDGEWIDATIAKIQDGLPCVNFPDASADEVVVIYDPDMIRHAK